jgi:hypothetical protein
MPAFERTVTGIPLWLLRQYLEELGGQADSEGAVSGTGWQARLTQVEDYQIGSVRVGRVRIEIDGVQDSLDRVLPALEKKLLRAGG